MTVPNLPQSSRFRDIVGEKDEHVLAAAVEGAANVLLTLDQTLENRINQAGLTIRAMTPGEFIKSLLPEHPGYGLMR